MPRLTTRGFNYFLLGTLLALLILPSVSAIIPFAESQGKTNTTIIAPDLERMMNGATADEMLPLTLEFESSYSPYLMEELLNKVSISGIEIRNIFRYIPFVSLYATQEAIMQLVRIEGVVSVNYDNKIETYPLTVANPPASGSIDAGYVPPTEILDAEGLWDQGYNGTGVTVAVIDSGVDGSHPDLNGKIIGFYDLVNDESDLNATDGITSYDDNGHGTAVSWLITGSGKGTDYAYSGIAVGAKILAIKTLDEEGAGDDSIIAQGIEFAISSNVDVISLSIGGEWLDNPFYSDASAKAAKIAVAAGIIVVVAAGNSGPATGTITSPGIVQEVITVGASIGAVDVVSFSSRGPVYRETTAPRGAVAKPDVLAPGYGILTGIASGASPYDYLPYNTTQFDADYTLFSGTSAAAPQIAALAALLLDKHPALTPIEAKTALMKGATDLDADSLEQGYGLANVTRASEIISDTAGLMTLITPLRYPTLPGTSQVLIVGDSRSPMNATVISTVNRGVATIETEGNASQFVITSQSVDVGVGYSYFNIGLEVPHNLPLSALGKYVGTLDLIVGTEIIASMKLDLLITTYGGKMLVDMGHHSSTDPDDVSYYRYFSEYLREQGMVIGEYPENWEEQIGFLRAFDAAALSSTEVLMIMDTEQSYSQNEIDLIHSFVENGGILLILSEGFDSDANMPAFAFESYNRILEPYGIQVEDNWIGENGGQVYGADIGGAVDEHPLTEGVRNLYVLNGGTFSIDSTVSGAKGLVWTDSAKTHALVAVGEAGKGKVIAISDGSMLYDSSIYDAELNNADNLKLLENVAKAIVPNLPRIYDVALNYGEVGEAANLTAYIFDDNIDTVNISLTGPDGEEIDAPLNQEFGYKYTIDFVLESTGFYDITVTVTDLDGYVRTYAKTILIPVKALDDAVLMGVVYGLLGIVGIALAYVGILKFGRGRKLRRHVDREWSPRWETDDSPPSIE